MFSAPGPDKEWKKLPKNELDYVSTMVQVLLKGKKNLTKKERAWLKKEKRLLMS